MKLHEKEERTQKEILDVLLEFKFDYQENIEKAKLQETKESVDLREEFRAIHSENLLTMKRMMSDCHLEVVQPLMIIQEGIERNLKKSDNNKEHGEKVEQKLIEEVEEERRKGNTIPALTTLNLNQSKENKRMIDELEKKLETKEEA
jgi:hypothetical protein